MREPATLDEQIQYIERLKAKYVEAWAEEDAFMLECVLEELYRLKDLVES